MLFAALLPLSGVARATTFEQAAAELADEDFSVREDAERFLQALPLEDVPRLEALARQPDPEVAFRARRALLHVRLRMVESIPADLAAKIADIRNLPQGEISRAFQQLMEVDPHPLLTLAGLHSEILANRKRYPRVDDEIFAELSKSVAAAAAAASHGPEIARIRVDFYQDETLALLAEGYAKLHTTRLESILPVYSRWVAQRPGIVPLLARWGTALEITRIEGSTANPHEQVRGLLNLARKYENPSDQRKAVLARMTQLLREHPGFPVESLDLDSGFTYFAALEENWDPAMDVTPYRKFRDRFPGPHPEPEASILEATYLLEKEGFNAALALALRQRTDRAAVWLGTWLQAHPKAAPKPFVIPPLRKEERRHAHLTGFFNALVPFRTLPEMEDNPETMAVFHALAGEDKLLETALQSNVGRLVYFEWIRRGTLDESIPKFLAGSTDRLRELGRLLVTKPETMKLVDPVNQSAADLQRILLGMLEASPLPPGIARVVFSQADRWQSVHSDLWQTDSFRFDIPRIESLAPTRREGLHGLLKMAVGFEEETPAMGAALRAIRRYQADASDFPVALLTADEGYLFFRTFGTKPEAKKLFGDAYLEFRRRFPGPAPAPEACPLEVLTHLEEGQIEKAFGLALLQDSSASAQWIGEWLHEQPGALARPLFVPFNRGNLHQAKCDALLGGLAPWRTLAELDANPRVLAAYEVLAEAPVWIEAATRGSNSHLACHHFLRAERLDKAVATTLSGKGKALNQLGEFLAEKPGLLAAIKPENQKTPDLRAILDGLSASNPDDARQKSILETVASWRQSHPGLPEKIAFAPARQDTSGQTTESNSPWE